MNEKLSDRKNISVPNIDVFNDQLETIRQFWIEENGIDLNNGSAIIRALVNQEIIRGEQKRERKTIKGLK